MVRVVERMGVKLLAVLEQSWGCGLWLMGSLLSFLSPVKYGLLAILVFVVADLVFGTAVSLRKERFILSYLLRETPAKLVVYFGSALLIFTAEALFFDKTFFITKSVVALACVCEGWSILGNWLVLFPNMLFPRLLKLQLKGEVEKKLGTEIHTELDNSELGDNSELAQSDKIGSDNSELGMRNLKKKRNEKD